MYAVARSYGNLLLTTILRLCMTMSEFNPDRIQKCSLRSQIGCKRSIHACSLFFKKKAPIDTDRIVYCQHIPPSPRDETPWAVEEVYALPHFLCSRPTLYAKASGLPSGREVSSSFSLTRPAGKVPTVQFINLFPIMHWSSQKALFLPTSCSKVSCCC